MSLSYVAYGSMAYAFLSKIECGCFAYSHWSGIQHRQRTQRTRNLLVPLIKVILFQYKSKVLLN